MKGCIQCGPFIETETSVTQFKAASTVGGIGCWPSSKATRAHGAFAARRILGPLEALLQQNSEMYEKYCDDAAGAKK